MAVIRTQYLVELDNPVLLTPRSNFFHEPYEVTTAIVTVLGDGIDDPATPAPEVELQGFTVAKDGSRFRNQTISTVPAPTSNNSADPRRTVASRQFTWDFNSYAAVVDQALVEVRTHESTLPTQPEQP